jgi:hypothetical protein
VKHSGGGSEALNRGIINMAVSVIEIDAYSFDENRLFATRQGSAKIANQIRAILNDPIGSFARYPPSFSQYLLYEFVFKKSYAQKITASATSERMLLKRR